MTATKEGESAVGAAVGAKLTERLRVDATEQFYADALSRLSGPRRRTAIVMRALNITYWSFMIAVFAWLFSQAIDREMPATHRQQHLVSKTVKAGEELKIQYVLDRVRVCSTDVSWTIRDSAREVHRFGPMHIDTPGPLGHDDFIHPWATPPSAAVGPAKIHVTLAHQCRGNYLQAWYPLYEELPDVDFEILPR